MSGEDGRWARWRGRVAACGALIVLASVLGVTLPRSLFEWDEVLFARAVEHYDAAANSPHMPGYPAFVAACRVLDLAVRDPVRAVQLASALGAAIAVVLVFTGVRREAGEAAGWLAAVTISCCPCFLWYGAVGLSDATGAALSVAVLVAVLDPRPSPSRAAAAGALAALAVGVRAQAVYALIPTAAAALVLWRDRRPARVAAAAGAAVAVSALVWVPAVVATGASRWWAAFAWQLQWVDRERRGGHALPYASLGEVVDGWLVRPFGSPWLALGLCCLVAAGFWGLVRTGRGRLAFSAAAVGGGALTAGFFHLNFTNGPRYVLGVLPFLAILVGGVAHLGDRGRRPALVLLAVVLAGSLVWVAPGLALRRSESAPVASVLESIGSEFDPASTVVYHEPRIRYHAQWILGRAGFVVRPLTEMEDGATADAGETILVVRSSRKPIPADAMLAREWSSPQVVAMVPGRYLRCWALRSTGP